MIVVLSSSGCVVTAVSGGMLVGLSRVSEFLLFEVVIILQEMAEAFVANGRIGVFIAPAGTDMDDIGMRIRERMSGACCCTCWCW
jgi:hypothetical protein